MMNDFTFTPTGDDGRIQTPYYEDARSDFAPYYSSSKTVADAKAEVVQELAKLGAAILFFQEGTYGSKPKRHGYQIRFNWQGMTGLIRVAGLPMRSETEAKRDKVRVQALLNVRDWLKASVTQPVFSPGSHPLLMNLLVDGTRTMAEMVIQNGRVPQLAALAKDEPEEGVWQ